MLWHRPVRWNTRWNNRKAATERLPDQPFNSQHSATPHSPTPITQILLVRHGRSTFNEQGRFQGCSDQSVLTNAGKQAAHVVGALLSRVSIDAIYASPLQRVQQTLDAILEERSAETPIETIRFDDRLREVDLPAWEGLPFQQVREQFAAEYHCWKQRPHEFQMVDRDTASPFFPVCELYDRAQRFWQDRLPQHRGQTILIVGHGGSNHALISTALGLSPAQHHTLQQSNNGLSVLAIGDRLSSAELHGLNWTQSLGETLPKLKEGKHGLRLLLLPADRLFSTHIQPLLPFLAHIAIDFSLSAYEDSQDVVDRILLNHPNTVKLQVSRSDVPYVWQQSILQQQVELNHLLTGLVIAPNDMVKVLIAQAMGLKHTRSSALCLKSGTLSVLHYPSINHPPILQAFNIDPKDCSRIPNSRSAKLTHPQSLIPTL
ncbi:histidine phosphatase family protein [Thermocoleostomius sinensis]|uniref:Histidine phosphatase family protein n=1 Tax=Thermocoleostomius sinensis A174 TaxID=2016057 RepID=A0A9E8ZBB4_9CYAN|nr:histidine phosphatase family protein [Thermocoleostomius sinensis]WAL58707.1 histidine phosphatase family protein [Thermocoleostomius sinensis A174]